MSKYILLIVIAFLIAMSAQSAHARLISDIESYCATSCSYQLERFFGAKQVQCSSDQHCEEYITGGIQRADCITGACAQEKLCSNGFCTFSDADGDGYNDAVDCNPTDARIYPGAQERCNNVDDNCDGTIDLFSASCGTDTGVCQSGTKYCSAGAFGGCTGAVSGTTEVCDDGLDNDCDGRTDTQDVTCLTLEGITAPNTAVQNTAFTVQCESSLVNANCIGARIQGGSDCAWQSWDGAHAQFSCISSTAGEVTAECYISNKQGGACSVDSDAGTPLADSQTDIIGIIPSNCAQRSQADCTSDGACEFCAACNGNKASSVTDENGNPVSACVPKDTCLSLYTCNAGACGAVCDTDTTGCAPSDCSQNSGCYTNDFVKGTLGALGLVLYGDNSYDYYDCRAQPNACNLDTCSCSANECNADISVSCELAGTDLDGDGFDVECDGDNENMCSDAYGTVYPGAPEICDGIPDNNCDGIAEETAICCNNAASDDLSLTDTVLADAADVFSKDKVRDYYWQASCEGADCSFGSVVLCPYTDFEDACEGIFVNNYQTQVREYSAIGTSYDSTLVECARYCTGETQPSFTTFDTTEYAPGCFDGACLEQTFEDECQDEETLTDYYCASNVLKSTQKNCNDLDGFYDENGQSVYRDYACNNGACAYKATLDESELKQGHVRVRFKNMGSIPFDGTLTLDVNNFCSGLAGFTIVEDVRIPVHGYYEKTHNFLSTCTPVDTEFVCENQLNYGVTCVAGIGSGCGVLSKEQNTFESCETCCGTTLTGSTYEDACANQNVACTTSTVSLAITGQDTQIYLSNAIDNAGWCCK